MEGEGTIILVGFIAFAAGAILWSLVAPRRETPVVCFQTERKEQSGGSGCLLFFLVSTFVLLFLLSSNAG
jgi:hypothetical protein